jgi:tRNA threonylcarbamoyladenosine modification (KEOPS) complex  Pcc1 subunit
MKAKANVRLRFSSEKHLDTAFQALSPEMKASNKRSKATLKKQGEFLVLSVEADDTVALRAALNAYLRWMNSVVNVLSTLERAA